MPATLTVPGRPALVLKPSDRAPARARRYLTERFRELGCDDDFVGRVVVSELVTNAYKHVGFGHIVVRVFADERDGLVVIEVGDDGPGLPVVREESAHLTCGRGLLLMVQLVRDWGVRTVDEGGKVVWARCSR